MSQVTRSIIDVWKILTGEPNMGRLLQVVVQTAELFTHAAFGEIVLAGDSWTKLEYQFATEEEIAILTNLQEQLGARVTGVATRDGVKLELYSDKDGRRASVSNKQKMTVLNSIEAPLTLEGKVIGKLTLFNKPYPFSEDDQEFLDRFLEQVARSMERELLRSRLGKMETRMKGIFDAIADGILVIDSEGKPVIGNHACRRLMFPEKRQNSALAAILPSMINETQDEGTQEIVLLKPHAQVLSAHYVNIRDHLGRLREVIISLRNVTEAKDEERKFLQLVTMIVRRVWTDLEEFFTTKGAERRKTLGHLKNMVRNLIRLTEIKSGVLRIQRLPVNLEEIYGEVLPGVEKEFARRQLSIERVPLSEKLLEDLWVDAEVLQEAFKAIFAFHRRNLKPGAKLVFAGIIDKKSVSFVFQTPRESWKRRPKSPLLDWEKCVDWFLQEDNRRFVLDLPFARHIVEAHKGNLYFKKDAADYVFEIRLSRELRS